MFCFIACFQILEGGGGNCAPASTSSVPAGASRGRKQLQAYMDSKAFDAASSTVASGGARPLHEVRHGALQDINRAQAAHRANARNGTTLGAGASSVLDDGMKAGLKRNLASMQHVLPGSGAENACSGASRPAVDPVVSAALAANQAAEVAAREKREAYEAWRDSMKKAKLTR